MTESGPGRMTRAMCSAILSFEAVMMLLSILVLNGFSTMSPAVAALIGCSLFAASVVAIGGFGRSWGYPLGHALQVAFVGLGFVSRPILFIGLVFAALWITAYVMGLRIDRERRIR